MLDNSLQSPQALPAFVLSTARNVIREHIRREYRTERLDLDEFVVQDKLAEPSAFLDPDVKTAIEAERVIVCRDTTRFLECADLTALSAFVLACCRGISGKPEDATAL